MSYILDALRRAEAERERGSIPSLHTRSPVAEAAEGRAAPRRRAWAWGGAALGLLLLGAAGARWLGGPASPPPVGASAAQTPNPNPNPNPTPAPVPTLTPAPAPAVAPAPLVAAPPRPAQVQAQAQAQTALPAPRLAASAAVPERPLPTLAELPEALRRELPPLAAGGAMYSETPAHRMLLINGQVFREGEQVAPALVLEQIQLRRAVLSYKGQRFGISY